MSTAGPRFAGTGGNDSSIGAVAWTNGYLITADDANEADCSLGMGDESYYLAATNFGFTIPSGSTIQGVAVEVDWRCNGTPFNAFPWSVKLIKGGTISGDEKASGASLGGVQNFGGTNQLWGLSLSSSDVNASDFGVGLSVSAMMATQAYIDYVTITITYTAPATGPETMVVSSRVGSRARPAGRSSRSAVTSPFDAAAAVAASGGEIVVASFAAAQSAAQSQGAGRSGRSAVTSPFDVHVDPHPPAVVVVTAGRHVPYRPLSRVSQSWPEDGQGVCDCDPGGVLLIGAGLSVTLLNRGTGVSASETPLATLQVVVLSRGTLQVEKLAPHCDC